ncbi:MAG: site-2 protease family protein [Chloroflexi bacterium]|nr:site-2 protease family protein [Chloroflexota bacterium]
MGGSFSIGRILGIEIRLHVSWFFVLVLFTLSLSIGYFPERYPELTGQESWLLGATTTLLLFVCVLAHELAHSIVAKLHGIPVEHITLLIFGGLSNLEHDPRTPAAEFRISIAGPLSSLALAALSWLLSQSAEPIGFVRLEAVGWYLAQINLVLALFNLLPGFPLDGGRVLRSAIWALTGSFATGTRIAAQTGEAIGRVLIFGGLFVALGAGNGFGGLWLMFIGWFLTSAATEAYRRVSLEEALHGLPVSRVMTQRIDVVPADLTVRALVQDHVLPHFKRAFLVTDGRGLPGLVTVSDIRRLPDEDWDHTEIGAIMTQPDRLATVSPSDDALTAMRLLADRGVRQLPVIAAGEIVGFVELDDILRAIELQEVLRDPRRPSGRRNADPSRDSTPLGG